MFVTFTVDGRPVPKGRPRVTRHGTYTPRSTQEFERRVRKAWEESGASRFPDGAALSLTVFAHFPIPKSAPKKRRVQLNGAPHTAARGDIDNIVKSVMDALNGCAYADDSCISRITASKSYLESPSTTVIITEAET